MYKYFTQPFDFSAKYVILFIVNVPAKHRDKIGIFVEKKVKNVVVNIDGTNFIMQPSSIVQWQEGQPDDLQKMMEDSPNPKVTTSNALNANLIEGDAIMMNRGQPTSPRFDVVIFVGFTSTGTKLRCRILEGRNKGTVRIYNPSWFVQKLDNNLIKI